MHVCTCQNRTVVAKWTGVEGAYDEIYCENFAACPEEARTGIKNDDWLDFLASDLDLPPQKQPELLSIEPTAPWNRELIENALDGAPKRPEPLLVQPDVPIQPSTPPSMPLPAVLVTRRQEGMTSFWLAALVVVAFFGIAGVVGYKAYTAGDEPNRSGVALASAPDDSQSPSTPARSAPTMEAGSTALGAAPTPPDMDTSDPPVARPVTVASDEPVRERKRHHRTRRSHHRDRSTHRARSKRHRKERDPDADVDINRLPRDPSYSLHGNLAKLTPRRAAPAPASVATQPTPPRVTAGAARPTLPGTPGDEKRDFASLLEKATGREAAMRASAAAPKPVLPARLGPPQVASMARKLSQPIRRCAARFGFGKISIPAKIRLSGPAGKITSVHLGGRFAGSPVEACSRRALRSARTTRFRAATQALQIPVYVP